MDACALSSEFASVLVLAFSSFFFVFGHVNSIGPILFEYSTKRSGSY